MSYFLFDSSPSFLSSPQTVSSFSALLTFLPSLTPSSSHFSYLTCICLTSLFLCLSSLLLSSLLSSLISLHPHLVSSSLSIHLCILSLFSPPYVSPLVLILLFSFILSSLLLSSLLSSCICLPPHLVSFTLSFLFTSVSLLASVLNPFFSLLHLVLCSFLY